MRIACSAAIVCVSLAHALPLRAANEPVSPDKPIVLDEKVLTKVSPDSEVYVDKIQKLVVADGQVCLRDGFLEMFACLKGSKEHESLVAIKGEAYIIHAGLLLVGAKSGSVVQFRPKYVPASGDEIDIFVTWKNDKGVSQQVRAQSWIRDTKTKKEMTYPWVFAGSGFSQDDMGRQRYRAESGDVICVSNFASAMLDLPVESSESNDNLEFEAFTDRIPPKGTLVRLILRPKTAAGMADGKDAKSKTDDKSPPASKDAAAPKESPAPKTPPMKE